VVALYAVALASLLACGSTAPKTGGAAGTTGADAHAPGPGEVDGGDDAAPDAPPSETNAAPEPDGGLEPGTVGFRRLSDVEYANTVTDLLGVALPAGVRFRPSAFDALTAPDAGAFDNLATAPFVSAPAYQAYFTAAQELTERAFADPTARARILTCAPTSADDAACDDRVVRAFGLRAWRRPLDADEVTALVALARAGRAAGDDFAGSMKRVVTAILASESFLHRIELDPADAPTRVHALGPYEIASRLSYLLWSTMPDETLFQLAGSGALWSRDVLAAQAARLLGDARSDAFVRNFAGQWLGFRALEERAEDPAAPAAWTADLGRSVIDEARLYVTELLRSDRPLSELLGRDLNFIDARLAALYGLPPPAAAGATRVEGLDDGRKGFLGLAAFLAATSRASGTSPSRRGAAILQDLLCVDVGPDVPTTMTFSGTPRQRLAQLVGTPACGPCHLTIDPVGIGLENYDAVGRFRSKYAPTDFLDIDAVGQMPDGTMFRGVSELSDLLARDPRFLDCASRKALVYALGRPLVAADRPALARLRASWDASGQTLRGLLLAIVADDLFRFRQGEAP
jgi:hypothetical protein